MSWQAAEAAEELRRESSEQGLEQGLADKRALVVRLAERRFGSGTAERLRRILAGSGSELVDEAADTVVDCDSGDKLLARATNGPPDRWSGRAAAEHCRCPLFARIRRGSDIGPSGSRSTGVVAR